MIAPTLAATIDHDSTLLLRPRLKGSVYDVGTYPLRNLRRRCSCPEVQLPIVVRYRAPKAPSEPRKRQNDPTYACLRHVEYRPFGPTFGHPEGLAPVGLRRRHGPGRCDPEGNHRP